MKISLKKLYKKKAFLENLKNNLQKNNACYVLITCSQPNKEGKMQVELNYSGDENLAAYLIEGAKGVFDKDFYELRNNNY